MHINIKVSILVGITTSIGFIMGVGTTSFVNSKAVYQAKQIAKETIDACHGFNSSHDLSLIKGKLIFHRLINNREELTSAGWESLQDFSSDIIIRERSQLIEKIQNDESDEYILKAKKLLEEINKEIFSEEGL